MDSDELALLYSPCRNVDPLSPSYLMKTPIPSRSQSPWSYPQPTYSAVVPEPGSPREAGCEVSVAPKLTGLENDPVFTFVEAPPPYPPIGEYLVPSVEAPPPSSPLSLPILDPWSPSEAGCDVSGTPIHTPKLTGLENDTVFTFAEAPPPYPYQVDGDLVPSIVEPADENTDKTAVTGWACDQCDNVYTQKKTLQHHVLYAHADQEADWVVAKKQKDTTARAASDAKKRIKCRGCERMFGRKCNMEDHFTRSHADQNDPTVVAYKIEQNERKQQARDKGKA
jgi:hypothetical protein